MAKVAEKDMKQETKPNRDGGLQVPRGVDPQALDGDRDGWHRDPRRVIQNGGITGKEAEDQSLPITHWRFSFLS